MFFSLDLRLSGDVVGVLFFCWTLYPVRVYESLLYLQYILNENKECSLGGNISGAATVENSMVVPQKIKHRITI